MIHKTTNYQDFIFREDNREKIDQSHVNRLVDSIQSKNMLELRPIIVNDRMEIIDGQHRLLAAKKLGVEIFYQIEKKLQADDIIKLNVSKTWKTEDFFNFHCHHQKDAYLQLKNFMNMHNLSFRVSLNILMGESKDSHYKFKMGEYQFQEEDLGQCIETCWDTVNYIKKMNGFDRYLSSSRFWKALVKLVKHPDFENKRWKINYQKMVDHFGAKVTTLDYLKSFEKIYNWRNNSPIYLTAEDS